MAFSGTPTITYDAIAEIIDKFEVDLIDIRVKITYNDASAGVNGVTMENGVNLSTNFVFGVTTMEIGAPDLNIEFTLDAGDEVTKVELVFSDPSVGDVTMDEYTETGAIFTYGGKYVITGWSITLQV